MSDFLNIWRNSTDNSTPLESHNDLVQLARRKICNQPIPSKFYPRRIQADDDILSANERRYFNIVNIIHFYSGPLRTRICTHAHLHPCLLYVVHAHYSSRVQAVMSDELLFHNNSLPGSGMLTWEWRRPSNSVIIKIVCLSLANVSDSRTADSFGLFRTIFIIR